MSIWPAWKNPQIQLFHGTVDTFVGAIFQDGIDVTRGLPNNDFGLGFYTTTWRHQAKFCAEKKSVERARNERPAVVKIELDRNVLKSLRTLSFVRGQASAVDYWSFVYHCRHHAGEAPVTADDYDVVYGPLALPRADSVYPGFDQISFHGPTAQQQLLQFGVLSAENIYA